MTASRLSQRNKKLCSMERLTERCKVLCGNTYLENMRVPELMEEMLARLLESKPAKPKALLANVVEHWDFPSANITVTARLATTSELLAEVVVPVGCSIQALVETVAKESHDEVSCLRCMFGDGVLPPQSSLSELSAPNSKLDISIVRVPDESVPMHVQGYPGVGNICPSRDAEAVPMIVGIDYGDEELRGDIDLRFKTKCITIADAEGYYHRRRTVEFAKRAASSRAPFREVDLPVSSGVDHAEMALIAVKAAQGYSYNGKELAQQSVLEYECHLDEFRRTEHWAICAAMERESRLQDLVVEGAPGQICVGSQPPDAALPADAKWCLSNSESRLDELLNTEWSFFSLG